MDSLRSETLSRESNQEGFLRTVGTICDFLLSLCQFSEYQADTSTPQELCKSSLSVLAYFWKPYYPQKMDLKFQEGLLEHVTSPSLLEGLLAPIATLITVNQKKGDPAAHENTAMGEEHYARFKQYEMGFLQCWDLPDQRFSSQVSPDGITILTRIGRALVQTLLLIDPRSTRALLQHGDFLYQTEKYEESLRSYLHAGALETSYFCNPHSRFSYAPSTIHRMIGCLHKLQATSQAIVMSQMVSMGDGSALYKAIQNRPQTLNPKFFQFLWRVPLLELLAAVFLKNKDETTSQLVLQILRKPEINENNPAHIHANTTSRMIMSFLKELLRDSFGDSFR